FTSNVASCSDGLTRAAVGVARTRTGTRLTSAIATGTGRVAGRAGPAILFFHHRRRSGPIPRARANTDKGCPLLCHALNRDFASRGVILPFLPPPSYRRIAPVDRASSGHSFLAIAHLASAPSSRERASSRCGP